jgi:hypothetical protein
LKEILNGEEKTKPFDGTEAACGTTMSPTNTPSRET